MLPFPSPGDVSHPGLELESLAFPELAGRIFANVPPGHPMPPVGLAQLEAKNKGDWSIQVNLQSEMGAQRTWMNSWRPPSTLCPPQNSRLEFFCTLNISNNDMFSLT